MRRCSVFHRLGDVTLSNPPFRVANPCDAQFRPKSAGRGRLPTISAKPVGVGAACHEWIQTDEQSSLLMHIAAMESSAIKVPWDLEEFVSETLRQILGGFLQGSEPLFW
jgi:hypothetical protein